MRVGTAFFGEVEKVGGQCIRTKYFVLGLPLVPLGSFYFTDGKRGFVVPLHGTSVAAGYLRVGLSVLFVVLALRAYMISSWQRTAPDLIYPLVALGLALASLAIGRLRKTERAKRTVLRHATGLAADPRIVPREIADTVIAELGATLTTAGLRLDPAAFGGPSIEGPYREPATAPPESTLGLAFAYASYAARGDAAWATARDRVWQRMRDAA